MTNYNRMGEWASLGSRFIAGQGALQNQRIREEENARARERLEMNKRAMAIGERNDIIDMDLRKEEHAMRKSREERAALQFNQKDPESLKQKKVAEAILALSKNPNTKFEGYTPDEIIDVKLGYAKLVADQQRQTSNYQQIQREKYARSVNDISDLRYQAIYSLNNGPIEKAMADVLKFFNRARDGHESYKDNGDGTLTLTPMPGGGKPYEIPMPTKEQLIERINFLSQPEVHTNLKVREESQMRALNEERFFKERNYHVSKNGQLGFTVELSDPSGHGGITTKHFIYEPETQNPIETTEDQWKKLGMTPKKTTKEIEDDNAIVVVGDERLTRKDAYKQIDMLSKTISKGKDTIENQMVAALKRFKNGDDPMKQKDAKRSLLDQAMLIVNGGGSKAEYAKKFINLINAVAGIKPSAGAINGNRIADWRNVPVGER